MVTRYYNPNGSSILDERIHGSSPTGFIDFNRPRYKWASSIYTKMEANTWFPEEVNTNDEKKNFDALSENEQWVYKLTFGQLSFNDSIQSIYLVDLTQKTTNKIVQSALIRQSLDEVRHSKSYAVLLDAAGNSNEVFDLYKTNEALALKNHRIAEQFARNINGDRAEDLLLSALASVNLEGIYFLTGFGFIFTLGDKVPGARDMITFINRDEQTHLALFANIFKTIRRENNFGANIVDKAYKMVEEAVDIELEYGKHIADNYPILGLSWEEIERTVKNYADDRLKKIGMTPIYNTGEKTRLQKLVDQYSGLNETRSNFFESTVKNYAKATIDMDDF